MTPIKNSESAGNAPQKGLHQDFHVHPVARTSHISAPFIFTGSSLLPHLFGFHFGFLAARWLGSFLIPTNFPASFGLAIASFSSQKMIRCQTPNGKLLRAKLALNHFKGVSIGVFCPTSDQKFMALAGLPFQSPLTYRFHSQL